MKRHLFAMFVCLAGSVSCSDDDAALETERDPASEATCPCRLATQIDNLSLCVSPTTAFAPTHVYSTSWDSTTNTPSCEPWRDPQPAPTAPWSKVKVSSKCTGTGQLCVTVRAGSSKSVSTEDCTLATRCSAIAYPTPDQILELAPLAGWSAESSACALRHEQLGAYLEVSVNSEQLGCGQGVERTTRIAVCPARCQEDPLGPGCDVCGEGSVMTTF